LLLLSSVTDPLELRLRVNELASCYRMPAVEIRQAVKDLQQRTVIQEPSFYSLDEFLTSDASCLQWLIPNLLPKGETVLLTALPGIGKTLLAIDAAFCVATGKSQFLVQTVEQGRVLIISADESARSTKLKLYKRGFRPTDGPVAATMTHWDISQMTELEKRLEDFHPTLVIVDSLKAITLGREVDENSATFADSIYALKNLLTRYGASGILIHHANKNLEAAGVAKSRGSTAIIGAVWGHWHLDPIYRTEGKGRNAKLTYDLQDRRRSFSMPKARDGEPQSFEIVLDASTNYWQLAN